MTNHEIIELANTALALGDFFVPPQGTVIVLRTKWRLIQYELVVVETCFNQVGFGTRPRFPSMSKYPNMIQWVDPEDSFIIKELPLTGCPPFEDWKRL